MLLLNRWKRRFTVKSFLLFSSPGNISRHHIFGCFGWNVLNNEINENIRLTQTTRTSMTTTATTLSMTTEKSKSVAVIDSHLHVWGTMDDSISQRYPYDQDPPVTLQNSATVECLLRHMNRANIDGALIVQPINYLYDHSYVLHAIKNYPTKFKGMLLYDPTHDSTSSADDHAIRRLEELVLAGFVGVRFNPYLFPTYQQQQQQQLPQPPMVMSRGMSAKIYERCGQLHVPVGIMCFQGLQYHFSDIVQLIQQSPQTLLILDHFAFTKLPDNSNANDQEEENDAVFTQLLQLAQHPSVHVKISALFRMNDHSDVATTPTSSGVINKKYQRIYQERFLPLLQAFGSRRLLYGSDFPYLLEQQPPPNNDDTNTNDSHNKTNDEYSNTCQLVASWCPDDATRNLIMGGNAERLFGPWDTTISE